MLCTSMMLRVVSLLVSPKKSLLPEKVNVVHILLVSLLDETDCSGKFLRYFAQL